MSLLKRRKPLQLGFVAFAFLALLVCSYFLRENTINRMRCICQGEWLPEEGICANNWMTESASKEAPDFVICHLRGAHSEKQTCIGKWEELHIYPGFGYWYPYECHGLLVKQGQCFGIPYSAPFDYKGGPISCNYPCDDEQIREACKTQDTIKLDRVTVSCVQLENWCK